MKLYCISCPEGSEARYVFNGQSLCFFHFNVARDVLEAERKQKEALLYRSTEGRGINPFPPLRNIQLGRDDE